MRLAAFAAAWLLPAAAMAEEPFDFGPREYAVDEIAADLAYGFCPLYLAGQFPLTGNPMLAERGFGEQIRRTPEPRFGELEQVTAIKPDGNVAFGGVPGKVCSVTVTGADLEKVSERLHSNMAFMGLEFAPDPANTGDRGGIALETFKARVDGQMLYLQLARVPEPKPAIVAQLFGMAE